MKNTRPRGTTRAATPFRPRGHAARCAAVFGQADSTFGIEGVGMT